MSILQDTTPSRPDLTATLKRDIGLHRAAQTLADAIRCRQNMPPLPLGQLGRHEREFYRQAARHVIEIFETVTTDGEPGR